MVEAANHAHEGVDRRAHRGCVHGAGSVALGGGTRVGEEAAGVLGGAGRLEPESLLGGGGRSGRGMHHVRPLVVVEELAHGDHPVAFGAGGGRAGERLVERRGLVRARVGPPAGAHVVGGAAEPARARGQHRDVLGRRLLPLAAGRTSGALERIEELGEGRIVADRRDTPQTAEPPQRFREEVRVAGAGDGGREGRGDVGGAAHHEEGARRGGDRGGRGRAGRRRHEAEQLRGARAGALLLGLAPAAGAAHQDAEVVHRRREGAAKGGGPRERPLAERAPGPFRGRGERRDARQLGHGGGAAEGACGTRERLGVRPRRAGGAEQGVELLDVLAGFQNEEVE